ncbi:MAG TPA: polymer-forming cytoskeletal protein [Candidatus Saccharimonadales bacterium]|nr:polymer-forming cytoskeletal protein [Candidatus Saccharimonadales bacterium]
MKRLLLSIGLVLGIGAVSSLAWAGISHAADVRSGDAPSVGKNETIDGSMYIAGRTVTVDGIIKGDVFCAGLDVYVNGTVEGDVICAGRTVRVSGKVLGDVRVAGQQVDISATVTGSATLAGESLTLTPEATIGRDLTLGVQSTRLSGHVGRDVIGGGQDGIFDATIDRNVHGEFENVALGSKAKIGGDFTYRSPDVAQVADGASVAGQTKYIAAEPRTRTDDSQTKLGSTLFGFGSLLLIGLAAIFITPRWFDAVGASVRNRPFASFTYGAAILFGLPIVAGLLTVTLIGLPLAIMMLLVWGAALIGAMTITTYAVGWMVVEKLAWPNRGQRIASLLIGLLIMALIGLIPIIGGIAIFAALLFGLGSIAATLVTRLRPRKAAKGSKA